MGKKIKATFNDYSVDLVSLVGMSMNGLVRKICEEQGCKPVKSKFLTPETATPEWLTRHIEWEVAVALHQRPTEKRNINELARRVAEVYQDVIEEWIEENKANLAEIGFLFAPPEAPPVDMTTAAPPVQNFAPPAVAPGFTAIVCQRGRKK